MESIKLCDIPVYTAQQGNVKTRIEFNLSLRDKDYTVIAKDVKEYFKLQSDFSQELVPEIEVYLFTKYKMKNINNVLIKLKGILNG